MEIHHRPSDAAGEFVLLDGDVRRGELTYRRDDDGVVLTHTRVDPALRGQGHAQRLVQAAVDWTEREQVPLRATCSYARKVLARRSR